MLTEVERLSEDLRVNAALLADATDRRTEALCEADRLRGELAEAERRLRVMASALLARHGEIEGRDKHVE